MKKILTWKKSSDISDVVYHDLIQIDQRYKSFGWVTSLDGYTYRIYSQNNNMLVANTLQEAKDILTKIADIAGYKVIDENLEVYL